MKKWLFAGMAAMVLVGCGGEPREFAIDEKSLRAEIMEDAAAKDFLITDSGAIYVGLIDNGGDRSGYARYVCETARSHAEGEGERLVKVIDIAAVSRGDGFKELGRHRCQI